MQTASWTPVQLLAGGKPGGSISQAGGGKLVLVEEITAHAAALRQTQTHTPKKSSTENLCFGISCYILRGKRSRQQRAALSKREIKQEANKAGQAHYEGETSCIPATPFRAAVPCASTAKTAKSFV